MNRRFGVRLLALFATLAFLVAACGGGSDNNSASGDGDTTGGGQSADCPSGDPVITLAAYSNVYDVYGKLVSAFQSEWKDAHDGQQVIFQTSFGGSTTQAQNVVNGFPADIVALSLTPDVQLIQDAGLITRDWQAVGEEGIVASSAVVFDVRPGNPLGIDGWEDLAQPGVEILTPDPAQSGGARWNIVAAYGAAMRGEVPGYDATPEGAQQLLTDIFKNVTVMDKSANDSIKNFQAGNGDVAITYEYAVLQAQHAGLEDEMVIPKSTVAIQTPVAVVDKNADTHCVTEFADAFVDYLHSDEAKELFTTVGFERSTDIAEAAKGDGDQFAAIDDLFTTDDIGGWEKLDTDVFGDPDGAFTKALAEAQG
jgi:sulfate/thiosulfate transport system substrate-binding protein